MKNISKALLQRLYLIEKKSGLQIAKELGIGRTTLGRYLDKFGIKHLSLSEVMTGRKLSPEHRLKVIKSLKYGQKGEKNPNWSGGKFFGEYVFIRMPEHPNSRGNGYIPEHRLVMEKHLGRYLLKGENIHHINGNKYDNRIENLEIVSPQHHAAIHWKTDEARKIQSEKMKKIRSERFWSSKKR